MDKKQIYKSLFLLFLVIVMGCSRVLHRDVAQRNSELQEHKHINRLIIEPAHDDDMKSRYYKLSIKEQGRVRRKTKEIEEIVIEKYPYSFPRKLDDFVMGLLGAPFAPMAIIGGIVNGEVDLIFFPFSAFNPFKNFRPDKSGLFSKKIPVVHEVKSRKHRWKDLGEKDILAPVKYSSFTVRVNGKVFKVMTNKEGIAKIDLFQVPELENFSDLRLLIRGENEIYGTHIIPRQRLISINKDPVSPLEQERKLAKLPTLPKKKPKALKPKPLPKMKTHKPFSQNPFQLMESFNEYALYKVKQYGYWVNKEGIAILALGVKDDIVLFADEYLRYKANINLSIGSTLYVFAFSFDPVKKINLSIKVGTSPQEEQALGWISSEDVYFWNTTHKIQPSKPLHIYPTYESSLSGRKDAAYLFVPDKIYKKIGLSVLEKKGMFWLVSYPTFDKGKQVLKSGWIHWNERQNLDLEIRISKHKLDIALAYLEKSIILTLKKKELLDIVNITLEGPYVLLKKTGEIYFSSLNRKDRYSNQVHTQMVRIPEDPKAYEQFQNYTISIGNLVVEKQLWGNQDIIHIPIKWLK